MFLNFCLDSVFEKDILFTHLWLGKVFACLFQSCLKQFCFKEKHCFQTCLGQWFWKSSPVFQICMGAFFLKRKFCLKHVFFQQKSFSKALSGTRFPNLCLGQWFLVFSKRSVFRKLFKTDLFERKRCFQIYTCGNGLEKDCCFKTCAWQFLGNLQWMLWMEAS